MRKPYKKPALPSLNDTRLIKKFAWFPTVVQDQKIWLESYTIVQRCRKIRSSVLGILEEWVWRDHARFLHDDPNFGVHTLNINNPYKNHPNAWYVNPFYSGDV